MSAAAIARIQDAHARARVLEQQLDDARRAYWQAVAEAHRGGMSLGEIAAELGISRERVRQLIDKLGRS